MTRTSRHAIVVCLLAVAFPTAFGCAVDSTPDVDEAEDELSARAVAGAYDDLGVYPAPQGHITWFLLRADKTFFIDVKGEYGCDVYAGYTCPSSWSSGRSGNTEITGTWKGTRSGLVLQPTGTGTASAPIVMTAKTVSGKLVVDGTIVPNRHIKASLTVRALFGKPHTATEADFRGLWKNVTPQDSDGDVPTITGTNVYLGKKYKSTVEFKTTGTYREERSDLNGAIPNRGKDDGKFLVGGAPDGKGAGVLILDPGYLFDAVPIQSMSATKMKLQVNAPDEVGGGRSITLQRTP